MSQMSIADEITVVEGHGPNVPYLFNMPGIARLCIPPLGEQDGPAGVGDGLTGVTQLPTGVGLAATFDPSLAEQYGRVIGAEERGKGASVNLGPTVNIDRDPRWGRSFETFTEDPFLNAAIATGEIDGVQSQGVLSQVKHFAAYNQETNRDSPQDDVIVSARALNEIYLPAFEAAVQQAGAASVMCSYPAINGDYACQNPYLLTDTLDQQWDFTGFVTSDYGALHDTLGGALGGTDQEQPFPVFYGTQLEDDVENGTVPLAVLNTMVQRILTEMFRFNLIGAPSTASIAATVTTPADQATGTRVADAAATLLENVRGTLPIPARHGGRIVVVGPAASASPTYVGGGSTYVIPSQTVSPLQGLRAAAGPGTRIVYRQGLPTDTSLPAIPSPALTPAYAAAPATGVYIGTLTAPQTGTYVLAINNSCACFSSAYLYLDGRQLIDDPGTPPVSAYSAAVNLRAGRRYSVQITGPSTGFAWGTPSALAQGIRQAVAAARSATTAVVVVSDDTESEGSDRSSLELPSAQNELISKVAAANRHTAVVIDAGAPVAMPWLRSVGAILDAWYPGQSNGTSLARVLFGWVDPSGHLPVTFPVNLSQVPASTPAQFPGTVTGTTGTVQYSEGVDVGYRWYDAKNITPLFPFGFGLSYTRFAYSHLQIGRAGDGVPRDGSAGDGSVADGVHDVTVSATITNVGQRAGADVPQLYVGDPASTGEPPRQLVGFDRVTLRPGRSARVRFTITPRDTWWWGERAGGWNQTAGRYGVYVGDSSALSNLPLRGAFTISTTPGARQVEIDAPASTTPGQPATVLVRLTASGDETLDEVALSLQAPQGWMVTDSTPTTFHDVKPSDTPTATFTVTPPAWAPAVNAVLHATASLGPDAQRESGVSVGVG
jgi:beta-glucosidase